MSVRRALSYTIFPYTTLFRSSARLEGERQRARLDGHLEAEVHAGARADLQASLTTLERAVGDRKSTRLNSSHGYISYAVFCWKKNKSVSEKASRLRTRDPRCC